MKKGVVSRYLCQNPSCSYSENMIEVAEALNISGGSAKFKVLKSCPKCKSSIEMINFVSGEVIITADVINENKKGEEDNSITY